MSTDFFEKIRIKADCFYQQKVILTNENIARIKLLDVKKSAVLKKVFH